MRLSTSKRSYLALSLWRPSRFDSSTDGAAVLLAAVIGMIPGRSATRPLGELVLAAQRIRDGRYDTAVNVSGGDEFRSLATTFNTMQRTIAAREADITRHAFYDTLTELPKLLKRLHCDYAQGYLISPPIPAADVAEFVRHANDLLPASDSTVMQIRALEKLGGAGKA